jgi:hypothetical protein
MVAELGKLPRDEVLSPERVFLPHPADEDPGVRVDRRSADRTPGTTAPDEPPERAMPANHGFRAHDGDGVQERGEDPADPGDGKAITRLEAGMRGSPPKDDELLAEKGVLGEQSGARAKHPEERREETGHKLTDHCGRVSAGAL